MTDRELLELAAKACSMTTSEALSKLGRPINLYSQWNPLEDDGDALRLAVKLGININFGNYDEGAVIAFDFKGRFTCRFSDCEESGDPNTATRRAIVRAAALIGSEK